MIKEFPFHIDEKLKHKLDILISQLDKDDIWILVDGDEGSGKTNTAAYLLYYIHCITGWEFTIDQFYYDTVALFEFAKRNSKKLLNWDEAALGGLSSEWWKESQINLIKLALTGRIKHHVFILCIPRFEKLKVDLRLDRIHAIIHMDRGKRRNRYGDYIYLTRRGIINLNRIYAKNKTKPYRTCSQKYGGFLGHIPFVLNKILDVNKLNQKKEDAIASIGNKKQNKSEEKIKDLKFKISKSNLPIEMKKKLAESLGISYRSMQRWGEKDKKDIEIDTPFNNDEDTRQIQ